MTKEEFNTLRAAFLKTQDDKGRAEWYCSEHAIASEVLVLFADYLFPTPVPVTVDRATLQEAIEALEAADGTNVRTGMIIAALTKSLNGGTSV